MTKLGTFHHVGIIIIFAWTPVADTINGCDRCMGISNQQGVSTVFLNRENILNIEERRGLPTSCIQKV